MSLRQRQPLPPRIAALLRLTLVAVLGGAALVAGGCTERTVDAGTTPEPAQVDIRLRLRPSCGFDTALYDTQCLQALLFVIHLANGDERRVCEVLDNPPENIQRLVFAGAPQVITGALTTDGEVYFEVIGLHNKNPDLADAGAAALCDDADNFDNQLFFGSSATLNLSSLQDPDAGPVLWEISIDCRDCEQGCAQLGSPTCPTNPISFCVPGSANLLCEKPCQGEDGADCFEKAMTCDLDEGRCDQGTADLGGFCQACMSDDDCLGGDINTFCVGLPGQVEGLCAYRCPQNRCPNGARCNRLGNRLRRIGVELTPDTDGGVVLDGGVDGGS